jgi:phospholipid transport system transporter-binding protein
VSIDLDMDDGRAWAVKGELTFASVPEVQESSLEYFSSPPEALDMAGVARIDSAGIALIIEWARRAKLAGKPMRLINVPAGMTALSKTTGLTDLLNIDGSS